MQITNNNPTYNPFPETGNAMPHSLVVLSVSLQHACCSNVQIITHTYIFACQSILNDVAINHSSNANPLV